MIFALPCSVSGDGIGKSFCGVPSTIEVVTISESNLDNVDLAFNRDISEALFAMPRL
jgi:hypothetical protein